MSNPAMNALRHHVTGAIERGNAAPVFNLLYQAREGDFTVHITDSGFSQDVDAMFVGWIYTTPMGAANIPMSRATGLMWDESRILVYASQPLQAREVEVMRAAGFLVDDSFCP